MNIYIQPVKRQKRVKKRWLYNRKLRDNKKDFL